jgi:hypothetical protein
MFDEADEITIALLLKPIALGVIAAFVVSLVLSIEKSETPFQTRLAANFRSVVYLSVPIVILGYATGYLTGISRAAAIGNLIPAMLTLVGGLTIYLFKESSDSITRAVAFSVFMFGFSIFYGVQVGAYYREYKQADRLIKLSDQEWRVKNVRRNMIPPLLEDPPEWITGIAKN